MIKTTCTLDENTLAEFNACIDEMQKITGAEMKKVVRNASRDLARAALRHTPKADPKIRFLRVDKKYRIGTDGKPIYLSAKQVKPTHRGKTDIVVSKSAPSDPRTKIKRGLAKAGWIGCLIRLGVNMRAPGQSAMPNSQCSTERNESGITFANTIPFIEDFNNGRNKEKQPLQILNKAMRDVNARMQNSLDKISKKIAKRGF